MVDLNAPAYCQECCSQRFWRPTIVLSALHIYSPTTGSLLLTEAKQYAQLLIVDMPAIMLRLQLLLRLPSLPYSL